MQSLALVSPLDRIWPYIQIARVDHWFKNVFMMLGLVVACFAEPKVFNSSNVVPVLVALFATCMVASSNYVLNELLDGATDRMHPEKRHRPVPSGLINSYIGYLEWFVLGILGLWIAAQVNQPFFTSAALLWIMGMLYNIPPIRTKEWPYLDVLSESLNNPIRLLLGWFTLIADKYPPSSLVLAYWMVGAFFMGTKRLAEYRHIGDHKVAATYRRSFEYYTDQRLLLSVFFYATASAFFGGIFIVRYHLELILFVPLAAGVLTYYLMISFYPNSPVQHPEKLYREARFMMYLGGSMVIFAVLMFIQIPILYEWFLVEPSTVILWTLGR
jgi:decaprenyl-phosphate phosphoribosyltransferase